MSDWLIYRGEGDPDPDRIGDLPPPPPWREFTGEPIGLPVPGPDSSTKRRLGGRPLLPVQDEDAIQLINAALYLRRPLLVTGEPGSGKSTLAHAVAQELGLGRVLQWSVVSRTELKQGLYEYDAIGRLQDAQLSRERGAGEGDIGEYIKLGPLGTALLPSERPRVLLIDELDKSDIDLPNDLLNVLEEGEFRIPELERTAKREGHAPVTVLDDDGRGVPVVDGKVRCRAFPFVVMTSNGERDFPRPLLRRCIRLNLEPPRDERLAALVHAHFGEGAHEANRDLLESFSRGDDEGLRPTDELLNAIFLTQHTAREAGSRRDGIARLLMRPLEQHPQQR
ncbi:MoxR family ATPase [Streptomyces sp. NBC_01433]|uniref:AAA family ATPase n=1 Tax=Streptomyces sp. NBC_01433 TaxID=2903864 RepID=UPI002254413A|nr:MoxR family ATPase [Streptomyces sp. NBC_01433]MCX4674304.1 MoxR family ATPase [Streptomyces sp. NBC_01433]